eukprot:scaffold1484_cov241-Pinguiococcus_pyrenoidosus.AAC.29
MISSRISPGLSCCSFSTSITGDSGGLGGIASPEGDALAGDKGFGLVAPPVEWVGEKESFESAADIALMLAASCLGDACSSGASVMESACGSSLVVFGLAPISASDADSFERLSTPVTTVMGIFAGTAGASSPCSAEVVSELRGAAASARPSAGVACPLLAFALTRRLPTRFASRAESGRPFGTAFRERMGPDSRRDVKAESGSSLGVALRERTGPASRTRCGISPPRKSAGMAGPSPPVWLRRCIACALIFTGSMPCMSGFLPKTRSFACP